MYSYGRLYLGDEFIQAALAALGKQVTVVDDPFCAAGVERAKAAVLELQRKGIVDADGRRIRRDLPPDTREPSRRDFAG